MNEPFYVEVTKCSEPGWWYASYIGRIFLVKRTPVNHNPPNSYQLAGGLAWIKKSDCRRVKVEVKK